MHAHRRVYEMIHFFVVESECAKPPSLTATPPRHHPNLHSRRQSQLLHTMQDQKVHAT